MADTQQLKENVHRLFEIFNSGDVSDIGEYLSDDFSYRSTSGEEVHGLDEFQHFFSIYNDAFDNLNFEIEEIFLHGNKGVTIYRQTGTHTGEFMGMEPTNNDTDVLYCSIGTFDDDGKLVDVYDVVDTLDLLNQLEMVPDEVTEQLTSGISATRPGA